MTFSTSTVGLSLTDFIAHDLPTDKWMKLIRPKMRLHVRTRNRDFVSSSVRVENPDGTKLSSVHWPWNDDERPVLAYDENFMVEVERRFLLRYNCIRRTERVAINREQFCNSDRCAMPLYDGQMSAEMVEGENRVEMKEITFTLQSGASQEDATSTGEASASTHTEEVELYKEQKQRTGRRRVFWRFWQT